MGSSYVAADLSGVTLTEKREQSMEASMRLCEYCGQSWSLFLQNAHGCAEEKAHYSEAARLTQAALATFVGPQPDNTNARLRRRLMIIQDGRAQGK